MDWSLSFFFLFFFSFIYLFIYFLFSRIDRYTKIQQHFAMLQVGRQLWRPSSFKLLWLSPRLSPGSSPRSLISTSCFISSLKSLDRASGDWGSLQLSSLPSWSIREAHSGTAGKSHGRRKKSIKPSLLQYTKRGDALEESTEEDITEDSDEKESKGQSKRKALRALKWANELATFSPSQLRQAIRWASLDEEVYDAVMLVKSLSPNVRNGKRRQFNFIGGLLREADPELMEQVLTACKDGDLSGLMARIKLSKSSEDPINEKEASDEEVELLSEEAKIATRWLQGLLDGERAVNDEVFSTADDVYFDRQELKKLMRAAKGTQLVKSTDRSVEATKAYNTLFDFLFDLAQRRENDA